jgi:hypothetical protein
VLLQGSSNPRLKLLKWRPFFRWARSSFYSSRGYHMQRPYIFHHWRGAHITWVKPPSMPSTGSKVVIRPQVGPSAVLRLTRGICLPFPLNSLVTFVDSCTGGHARLRADGTGHTCLPTPLTQGGTWVRCHPSHPPATGHRLVKAD